MSQAALNVRNRETKFRSGSGCSNGARLAGMVFLLMVIGVMVAGGLVVLKWMNDTARLPLSRLVLTGKTHYTTSDDVRRAILSLGTPGTFMSQDVDIIQQQIERLPWIQQVSVRKQWPDELKIHLVEYVPVARWNDLHMVDAQGQSFSVPAKYSDREVLPMLYGPEGSEQEVLEGYHQMRAALDASRMKLKAAVMTARRSWQLTLADDTRIDLGREKVMQRLTRFIELYPALQQQGQSQNKRITRMDLRYDSGAAVEWAPALVELQDSKQQQDQTQAQAKQQ